MPGIGSVETVNFASRPRKRTLGEQIKSAANSLSLNTVFSGIAAVAATMGGIALLSGWLAGSDMNAHDMHQLQQQLADVQMQSSEAKKQAELNFDKLSNKLDTKLGPDALIDTVRRLSEISGRLDAIDQRQREDEKLTVQMQTQLESIEHAKGR